MLDVQPRPPRGRPRAQVLAQAAGNPMAVIELARVIADDPAASRRWAAEPLPPSDRLTAVLTSRFAALLTVANFRTFPGGANGNFFTCNDRQHSMLIVEWPMRNGVQHINLEVATLDDVGRALDRASPRNLVRRTLGKHVNDNMVSFYLQTPGGFQVEYGFSDGDPLWRLGVYFADSAGSYWGHKHLA